MTPQYARQLIDAGYRLTVEESSQSAFAASEYQSPGCELVPEHSWYKDAPRDSWVLGLKELEAADTPLIHRHIHFAHVYKNQAGWQNVLRRFVVGGGELYDLEFLVDEKGRRVAAFGHWAGFAGAAVALMAWCNHVKQAKPILPPVTSSESRERLLDEVRQSLRGIVDLPQSLVIGARGRAGQGAVELFKSVGLAPVEWDLEETKGGGPFPEILDADILLNCVFVEKSIPPFLTRELIQRTDRRLSVISDVSCDPYGEYNPIPIYDGCTTFAEPVNQIVFGTDPLYLIAIDHLPSMLPRESSEDFCSQLMPHLLKLSEGNQGVWGRAHELFLDKSAAIEAV